MASQKQVVLSVRFCFSSPAIGLRLNDLGEQSHSHLHSISVPGLPGDSVSCFSVTHSTTESEMLETGPAVTPVTSLKRAHARPLLPRDTGYVDYVAPDGFVSLRYGMSALWHLKTVKTVPTTGELEDLPFLTLLVPIAVEQKVIFQFTNKALRVLVRW